MVNMWLLIVLDDDFLHITASHIIDKYFKRVNTKYIFSASISYQQKYYDLIFSHQQKGIYPLSLVTLGYPTY